MNIYYIIIDEYILHKSILIYLYYIIDLVNIFFSYIDSNAYDRGYGIVNLSEKEKVEL